MPPPPPPPGPPLPPPPPAGPLGGGARKGASNDKGQLLADIRKGTGLRKVTTNDRSAPIIDGNKQNANGSGDATRSNGAPQGLGGLFAGGMPKLKSTVPGRPGIQPLKPPGRIVNDSVENKSKSPSPQPKFTTHSEVPIGYGTMRRPFPNDIKPQAPQPPSVGQIFNKPSVPDVTNNNVNRLKPSPPLPSKPHSFNAPKIQMQQGSTRRGIPGAKPPPPPKSPGTNMNMPPALPSKPPSLQRHQSMNENDWRHRRSIGSGGSPVMVVAKNTPPVMTVTAASSMTAIPTAVNNTMDNNNRMGAPPPYGQHTRNGSTPNVSMHGKQNHAPPPPPSRNTPYAPRPPPPPPPSRVGTQQVQHAQSAPPPPPPPHRTGPPPPPPGQPNKQAALPGQGGQALPPPPPARNFSTRNSASGGDDFESRFAHLFHSENDIPQPGQFIGHKKYYPSENAKNGQGQRNPPPPPPTTMKNDNTHYQLGQKMFAHEATKC